MRIVAVISERSVITKVLAHLGTLTAVTGWCNHRTGQSLLEQAHSSANTFHRGVSLRLHASDLTKPG